MKIKNYGTGEDAYGVYREFIKSDLIKPLERDKFVSTVNSSNTQINFNFDNRKDKWSLYTTKNCVSPEKMPKFQKEFREYKFPKVEPENSNKTLLKTDHIAQLPLLKKTLSESNLMSPKKKYLDFKSIFSH
jgi:hypothetical protein